MAIKRGTTPTHTILVDTDLTQAEQIYVTYRQNSYKIIEKKKDDFTSLDDKKIVLKLSQAETLKFKPSKKEAYKVFIQVKAKFPDTAVIMSNRMETTVEDTDKGVII